jgi:protein-tyrosine phosphatase
MKIVSFKELLDNPLKDGVDQFYIKSDTLIQDIQKQLQIENSDKKQLGLQLSQLKKLQKQIQNLEKIGWVNILDGNLSIGHRPSKKLMGDLKLQNCTHILTLLSESEGATDIESLCKNDNINWLWYSMDNAKIPTNTKELFKTFEDIKSILSNKENIYIHCSAGIHRTGMITLALLHYLRYSTEKSLELLKELREETYKNVGEERKEWAKNICKKVNCNG